MNVDLFPPVLFKYVKRPLWLAAKKITGHGLVANVHFRDMSLYGGVFDAPIDRVAPRVPPGFEPIETQPGHTEVHIFALDYRDVDWLAPYRELGVFVPARFHAAGDLIVDGQCVLQLPVTSEEARWTGVDNYGFPKFVADVRIEATDGEHTCVVSHAGQHVLRLSVAAQPVVDGVIHDRNLTVRGDGIVIASRFDMTGAIGRSAIPGTAQVELGYHAIADQLRELGVRVDTGRSVYAPKLRAVLDAGEELGPLPEAREPKPAVEHAPAFFA